MLIHQRVINTVMQFLNQSVVHQRELDRAGAVARRALTTKGRDRQDAEAKMAKQDEPVEGEEPSPPGMLRGLIANMQVRTLCHAHNPSPSAPPAGFTGPVRVRIRALKPMLCDD